MVVFAGLQRGGRRTASVLLALALMLLLVLALLGVRDRLGPHDVPSDPYAAGRPPGDDSSIAGPVATGGEVDVVAAGLQSL